MEEFNNDELQGFRRMIQSPYLPYGTELDLWEGKPYVSLVAFLFDEMNVMGLPAIWEQKV